MKYSKKIIILNEMTSGFSRGTARGVGNIEKTPSRIEATVNIFGLESLKSGNFIVGIGSKNLKVQKYNAGNMGRINIKFLLSNETDVDSPLYITVAFRDGDTVVPVLFGSNGNRKTMSMNVLDGFIERSLEPDTISRSSESDRIEFMDDLRQGEKSTINYKQYSETSRDGAYIKNRPVPEKEINQSGTASHDFSVPETNFAAERKTEGSTPYYWEPFKHNSADKDTVPMPDSFNGGVFAPEAQVPKAKDFPDIAEKYHDNQVAAENYYPTGYGINEAGFTIADNATVNKIDPSKIMLKKPVVSFYQNVRIQLDELFKAYPPEDNLNRKLPGTTWVKVDYNSNGKFYIVGLIGEEPKYICYGVPATYTKEIPEELTNCQWLPLSDEKPDGEGYWVMYQSADTGESVELEIM